jgi:hypothetical protein
MQQTSAMPPVTVCSPRCSRTAPLCTGSVDLKSETAPEVQLLCGFHDGRSEELQSAPLLCHRQAVEGSRRAAELEDCRGIDWTG